MRDPKLHPALNARLLETNEVIRRYVGAAKVAAAEPAFLLLTTESYATTQNMAPMPSGDVPYRDRGALRIDILSDTCFRVRFAERDAVPENRTPMVVGSPPPPTRTEVEQSDERVVYTTAKARLEVTLRPFGLRVTTLDGREVCEAGAQPMSPHNMGSPEKNHYQRWDTFSTGVCRTEVGLAPVAVECFTLRPQEAVYGLGEQFIRLNKVGQTIDVNMIEPVGVTTPRSYKNVPFFVSTNGYGVFFNHSCLMTVWLGSMSAADVQVALEDDFLDYTLFVGSIEEVLSQYTDVTGKAHVPPPWSFGFWQSKISYSSAEEALEVVRKMREHDFPLDLLHIDTYWFREDWLCDLEFDGKRFPDPRGLMRALSEEGVKVSLWQLPYIPEGSRLYSELAEVGGFVKDRSGDIYDIGICYAGNFKGKVGCIDFTNPAARRVYQRRLRELLDMGARCIKADFGEEAPLDGVYHDGTPGHRMRNLYPLLYNEAVAEVTHDATGEWIMWARSAWAGSQRYPLHWGGDSSSNWHNMVPQIEGGLSLGLSGFSFWSQDIGGFIGFTGGEMLVRWLQLGLFLSHARIHGMGPRELYSFEENVQRICRDYLKLRYRLLPYLWGTAEDSARRSLPMARPLVVEFQDDPSTWNIGDQWLLGDALLVAPITDPSNERSVYLPAGIWTDFWTGERHEGRRWIRVKAPLETLPLYLREGAIVPMCAPLRHVGERPIDALTLRITPLSGDGERRFELPVNGDLASIAYTARSGRHQVVVSGTSVSCELEVMGDGQDAFRLVTETV